jgi:hypothetical protein
MIGQRPCIAEIGAGRVPGSAPPGDEVAAERVGRCLQRLRQRLRVRLRVRYWLRVRVRRRQWPRLRPGFRRRWRRHWRGHRWRHWRRFHRFGPCRRRLRGFRLRCLTSNWSGLWCHLAGRFAVGHRGLTGTICAHPEMIPSRDFRPPRGGRPISTSCALTCAALRAGPARSIHAGRTARWHPDRTGVSIVSWTCGGLPVGVARRSARTATSGGRGAGDRVLDAVRVHSGAGRAHAGPGAPGGVLPGAGLPGGLALTLARADGPRSGRGAAPAARHAMPRAGARAYPRRQVRQPGQGVASGLPHRPG